MDIAEVLSGQAGLNGVYWALHARPLRQALRAQLAGLLSSTHQLGRCRLQRAKYKPGRKLTAYFVVDVNGRTNRTIRRRPVAVWWTLQPAGSGKAQPAQLTAQAEALASGLAAPFHQLAAEAPAWGMHVAISPLDARFPQLVRLSDPQHVRDILATVRVSGPGSAQPRPAAHYTVTPIRYRPAQRHVLRYDPDGGRGLVFFAKLYSGGSGARFNRIATRVADWLTRNEGMGLSAVRPAGYIEADDTILYPRVAGVPLSLVLPGARHRGEDHLRRAGILLRALHAAPEGVAAELEKHDLGAEVKLVARASEHIQTLLPAVGALVTDLLECAQELHERLPHESPGLAHGDFKCDHLWVTQSGMTLIDLDACCLADPAFDIGKFLADLHWWYVLPNRPDLEQAQAQFLEGYGLDIAPDRLARARLYEALWLIKLTARRFHRFDTQWAQRTGQMIGRAEMVLAYAVESRRQAPENIGRH